MESIITTAWPNEHLTVQGFVARAYDVVMRYQGHKDFVYFFAPLLHKSKKEFFGLYRFFDEIADGRLYDAVIGRRSTAEK